MVREGVVGEKECLQLRGRVARQLKDAAAVTSRRLKFFRLKDLMRTRSEHLEIGRFLNDNEGYFMHGGDKAWAHLEAL